MYKVTGYHLYQLLERNDYHELFAGYSVFLKEKVIIRVIKKDKSKEVFRYHRVGSRLGEGEEKGLAQVLRPLTVIEEHDVNFIIYEYFTFYSSLSFYNVHHFATVDQFLFISQALTAIVKDYHQHYQKMIGKLNPNLIFIDFGSRKIYLLEDTLENDQGDIQVPIYLNDLPYCSPELTGKMGIMPDFRSDLYNLGIIFYEIITKQVPFQSDEILELIYFHFTKIAAHLSQIKPNFPKPIALIVMKLLEKSPAKRYQDTLSLWNDLEECILQWETKSQIEPFPNDSLGFHSAIVKPKIVGREKELAVMFESYDRFYSGDKEFLVVTGGSGTGKTTLVREFHSKISNDNVIFLQGKWEQFASKMPFGPIIHAFKELCRVILSEGEEEVSRWRERLTANLKSLGPIVVELIPEFEWIIGPQSIEEDINTIQRHNSIRIAFQKILMEVTRHKPIILFIDDIQWADRATMDLLTYLYLDTEITNLFVLLAMRTEGEGENAERLEALQKMQMRELALLPFGDREIENWLKLKYDFKQPVSPLVKFLKTASNGNPLFIEQILTTLDKVGYIFLDGETKSHKYILKDVPQSLIGKDVVSHFQAKMGNMSRNLQELLILLSCLGNHISLAELEIITKERSVTLLEEVFLLVDEGFIYFLPGEQPVFAFMHDKIQQAIYTNIDNVKKMTTHYTIAQQLYQAFPNMDDSEIVFKITDNFNLSLPLLEVHEKLLVANYNRKSAEFAKASASFDTAYHYYQTGRYLLPTDHWEKEYKLSYEIYRGLGECAFLNGNFEEAEDSFNLLLDKAKTKIDKLNIYNLMLILFNYVNRFKEAVEAGVEGLKLYGWKLPKKATKLHLAMELARIELLMGKRNLDHLLKLEQMKDDEEKQVMQTLINMNAPAVIYDQNLGVYIMLRAFRFTLKHGDADISALVYINYALILSAGFGQLEKSCQYGNLALKHAEKNQVKKVIGRVYFTYSAFVNHWQNHLREANNYLVKAQKYCLEVGNYQLAGITTSFISMVNLLSGESLEVVSEVLESQTKLAHQLQFKISIEFLKELKSGVMKLRNEDNSDFEPLSVNEANMQILVIHATYRLMTSYFLGQEQDAKEIMAKLKNTINGSLVMLSVPEYFVYHSLWLCKLYRKSSKPEQITMRKTLMRNLKRIEKWAKQSPVNYLHKYLLVKLEVYQLVEKEDFEIAWYEEAIEHALQYGYQQDAAIINESCGRYYIKNGLTRLGNYYLTEAYRLYKQWGAVKKLQLLEGEFPNVFDLKGRNLAEMKGLDALDLESLIKSYQILANEIVLDRLINKLLQLVMNYAGATKGFIFLLEDNNLYLSVAEDGMAIHPYKERLQMDELNDMVSAKILHYIRTSQESIILHNACVEGLFRTDPYIMKNQVLSVIACPLVHKGQLIGIFYLENQIMTHAFTEKDLILLTTLGAQAATLIQNAQLYAKLEEKVKERTEELEVVNKNLEKANEELANAEKKRMELLSNISHDLKNPITSIQGYIDAMLDGIILSPEKQEKYLRKSREKLSNINRLIEDLFYLSKLQYGQMTFFKEVVSVEKLFTYLCGLHEWDVINAGLQFHSELSPVEGDYPLVEVDVKRLDQVFTNIITNSLKFTKQGEITVKLHVGEDDVVFEITDTGEGIREDEVKYVFDRSYKGQHEGNGLGLSICKEIIAKHDGQIWLFSVFGEGTSVYFSLPIFQLDQIIEQGLELGESV